MKVTVTGTKLKNPSGAVVGMLTVVLDEAVRIDGFKLIKSKNGNYFVGPPSTKKGEEWADLVQFPDDRTEGSPGNTLRAEILKKAMIALGLGGKGSSIPDEYVQEAKSSSSKKSAPAKKPASSSKQIDWDTPIASDDDEIESPW